MERIDKVQNLIPEKPEFVHSNQEKGEDVELSPAFDSFTGEYQAEIPFASDSIYLWAEGATPELSLIHI